MGKEILAIQREYQQAFAEKYGILKLAYSDQ